MIAMQRLEGWLKGHVQTFHDKRYNALATLTLHKLLKDKNPYLQATKGFDSPRRFIESLIEAREISQEETLFGNVLVNLAEFVCVSCLDGNKSRFRGIDLEFELKGILYLVVVKSGPRWSNSRSKDKLERDFASAVADLVSDGWPKDRIKCVNGIAYSDVRKDHGEYSIIGGQDFWQLISGDSDFYLRIVEALQHDNDSRRAAFVMRRRDVIGRFTEQFLKEFGTELGTIDWKKLVKFNSGKK